MIIQFKGDNHEKKSKILITFITATMLLVGCGSKDIQNTNIEEIALNEAKRIISEQGYTLKAEALSDSDVMIGDSQVFEFIKDASIKSGYSKDGFDSMTKDRKIIKYELEEKSKINEPIMLCIVVDKDKVIGAYLDYVRYMPGIEPIDFKDNFK